MIVLVNGANMNALGTRKPMLYGTTSLAQVVTEATEYAASLGYELQAVQSNHEGFLIDEVHRYSAQAIGYICNPGGLIASCWALRDALDETDRPLVEVHVTNPFAREPWRHHDVLAPIADGYIAGCGVLGYRLAVDAISTMTGGHKQ